MTDPDVGVSRDPYGVDHRRRRGQGPGQLVGSEFHPDDGSEVADPEEPVAERLDRLLGSVDPG